MPIPTFEELKSLSGDSISQGTSLLLTKPYELLNSIPGRSYEEKECELLRRIPKKVGGYYLVFRLHALWSNGGMQAVALDKDTDFSVRLLGYTPVAFEFFGCTNEAMILKEIVEVAIPTAREIDLLVQRDASDDEFEVLWSRLDAFDDRYDLVFANIYEQILADIRSNPAEWQINEA